MALILKEIFNLIRILNSETGAGQIALGISLGFILGLSPWVSLQGIVIFLLIIIFRLQATAALTSAFFFSFIAYVFDPIIHKLGRYVLKLDSLESTWTLLYNAPILPYTQFNNSIVMGGAVLGILLSPIIYLISYSLIKKYQDVIVARFRETKVWKIIKGSVVYNWYSTYEKFKP